MRSLFDRPTGVPGWQAWAGAHRRAKAPESSQGQRRFPVPDGCSELIDSPRAPLCAGAVFCCSRGHETQPWSPPIAVPWGGETWNPDTREGGGSEPCWVATPRVPAPGVSPPPCGHGGTCSLSLSLQVKTLTLGSGVGEQVPLSPQDACIRGSGPWRMRRPLGQADARCSGGRLSFLPVASLVSVCYGRQMPWVVYFPL